MITLYTIGCPKCNVLEIKLNKKNIPYEKVTDIEVMKDLGITSAPVLKVENDLLQFSDANRYIDSL